jgi:hypothetical protein
MIEGRWRTIHGVVQEIRNPQSAKEAAEDGKALRRGWYIGSEAFRDKLLDRWINSRAIGDRILDPP